MGPKSRALSKFGSGALGSVVIPSFRLPASHSSRAVEDGTFSNFDLLFGNTILPFGKVSFWLFLITTGILVPNSHSRNSEAAPFDLGTPHDNPHYEPYEFDNHLAWNEVKVPGIFLVGFLRALVVTTVFLGEHTYFFCEFFGGFDGAFYNNFQDNNSSGLYYLDTYHKDIISNGVYYLENHFEDFVGGDFSYIQSNEDFTFFDNFVSFPFGKNTMASSHGPGTGGGIPLHEFRKDTPPGWAPGLADYPLRLFFERLKLWYSIFDGDDTLVGPLVAGRLQGKAQRLGMQLRLVRPDGQYDVGSDALQRLSVEEVRDPNNPAVIIQHAIPSGVQALCNSLKDAFGMSDQEIVSRSIEDFFEFKRGKLSFQEYAIEWDIRLEEATTKAGLELNDVAKFYLFFRGSGLPQRFIEDIKLQLQGDLRRYVDARTIALRLITKKDDVGDSYYEEQQPEDLEDSNWDGYWTDDSWSWVEDYEPSEYYEDPWTESSYYEDEAYDWYDSEDHPSYVDESSADLGDSQEGPFSESYPVKGKGKGFGCTICGSRWHSAASCPVNNGKAGKSKGKGKGGKSKGTRKGSGKGYKGKSYGKRPSFGKSRGKGSWWPSKGYHGYAEYDYYGKTLSKSFGETTAIDMQPKAKTVHFQLDTEEAPVLNLGRARPSDEPPRDGDGEPSSSSAPTARRLDLSFPTSIYSDHTTYHTVLGEKRRGLLVDPGAASGLIGSETLRDILESCVPSEKSATVSWNHDRSHSVSGINGTPEETLGEVSFPLTLAGASGSFSADVLGGEGSLCPALLSNPSLRKQKASLLLDYFANGDAVMVVSDGSDGWHYLRLLLTDSGHYLLPIDNNKSVSSETKTKVAAQLYTWSSEISQRWNDVRHCFLQHGQCRSSREHERSERHCDATTATHDNDNQSTIAKTSSTTSGNKHSSARDTSSTTTADSNDNDNQDTIAKTSSTTSGFNGHRSSPTSGTTTADIDHDHKDKTLSTTSKDAGPNMVLTSGTTTLATANNHDNRATIAKTSSTTSGRYFNDDAKHISGRSSKDAKHISGRSFLDGPSGERPMVQDSWRIDGEYLVRDHRVPRRALFVPGCTVDCPVPADRISEQRVTTLKAVARRAPPRLLEDEWRSSSTACKDMEYLWTGTTRFKLVPDRAPDLSSSASTVATDEATKEDSLDPSIFPCYGGDRYPSHWSDERCAKAERYYKSVPEEYYSRSGRRPITPDNIESWMSSAANRGLRFQAWEWFSGSGRLSLCLLLANIVVGPPIDYRYGWDVSYAPHQELLQKCQAEFQPVHLFASPSWNQWTEHSAVKDKHLRDVERRNDLPSLQYLSEVMGVQHLQNRGFTVEQPLGSAMFKESPLGRLRELDGVRTARLDQCMFGAQDDLLNPLRKATCLLTNRKWHRVLKRCGGHRGKAHGTATGRVHGCSRSDLATVFPKRLCQALAQDFWVGFRSDSADKLQAWPSFLFGTNQIFYTCERCQLGRAAPPGCEHTLVPGECRYGQPSMRASRARAAASTEPTSSGPSPSSAPSAPADAPSAQPALRQQDLEDITGPFKFLARSGDYSRVQLEIHTSLTLDIEARLYLKAALMQLIESCLDIFSENTSRDLKHWLSDPILLRVFQDVFSEIMNVLGVMVCLRPWNKQVPDPQLSSTVAPMRLLINGHIRSWYIGPLEDMRVLSHRQLHDPVDEADWHVYLFGVCHEDYDADRPLPPGTDPAVLPQAARPAAPLVPVEKKSVGKIQTPLQPPSADLEDAMEYQPSEAEAEEEFDPVRPDEDQDKSLKPLFDFKKVYKRLQTDLLERDPHTAKRLLLGLHERFYHCPISDFKNMLLRAGLSSAVLPLAEEAVMSCSICRKYVRLPNRPQIKIGAGASSFNLRVQMDLFQYKGQWVLLMIDEATRYKAACSVSSREHHELLSKIFEIWFVIFGPPYQLILDQETSLMSHEAGKELERFSVERVPKGTTAGTAAQQHTGTGLIERHVGLTEISMMKLEAELDRQGISTSINDLARECVMSHNMSLNYGGVTPSMAVFGVIPRPFYQDDCSGVTAIAGALQTDVTPFEKALRIRQLALSTVQKAVAEDRIARANRTRTQQLELGELVPGVTRIDFHRETQGDVGWRGPAELLKVNKEEGTAIISYQGRPYLVSLRHIRPHQAGVFVVISENQEASFLELQRIAEQLSPYKAITIGWVPLVRNGVTTWTRASTTSLSYHDTWPKVVSLARALSRYNAGGAILGQSLRALHPPKGSVGVLLLWTRGDKKYSCHEHNNDQPIVLKKITANPIESTVIMYIYYFVNVDYRPQEEMKVVPSEGATEQVTDQNMDATSTPADGMGNEDVTIGSRDPGSSIEAPSPMEEDNLPEDRKRKGPESRTVVVGPESKRTKVCSLVHLMNSEKVHHRAQHVMINLYWIMHWTQAIPMSFPMTWYGMDNNVPVALWDIFMSRSSSGTCDNPSPSRPGYLFTWPGKKHEELYASLDTGQIYKVDDETDNISEDEIYDIWQQVEEADAAEIKQFVETKSFSKSHRSFLDEDTVLIDAVWVRKWKRYPDGSRRVKSRLCARGCFDRQKDLLSTRSTTATRLSQRLLLSTAANESLDVESWDIGGAFLKGMNFEAVRKLLESKGIKSPKRKIAILAPANVWRHLAAFDAKFKLEATQIDNYVLICIKPVYGLSDAPLAWQLCLHGHFEEQGGRASLMDENLFYWCEPPSYRTTAMITTHVDDCGCAGKPSWLKKHYDLLVVKFGKVTRQQLPFCHCGVHYTKTADGYHMSQDDFCSKLKTANIPSGRKDDDALSPAELTTFRSILGGLLWLTATRLDLVADVCLLQSNVTRAKIFHLRQANNVVRKAKNELGQGLGIHFRRLRPPFRLACIHDSSAAGNVRNYAQEGILVLLCEDQMSDWSRDEEVVLTDRQCALLGGKGHVLWAHGAKAKRISYSTSHAETLAGISGLEASSLVAVRLSELFHMRAPATLQSLIACQEHGVKHLPVDTYTDCKDFYELCSGSGNVPQDKNQRLYVLAYREARMAGRVRWMCLIPTQSMTADALTKSMLAPPMMELLSAGTTTFRNEENHPIIMRSLPVIANIEEKYFDLSDKKLIKEIVKNFATVATCSSSSRRFMCMALLVTSASASSTTTTTTTTTTGDSSWFFMLMLTATVIILERFFCSTMSMWWRRLTSNTWSATSSTTSSATTPTSASTTTATSRPSADQSTWTGEDDMEQDKTTLMFIAGLEAENLRLRTLNTSLDGEFRRYRERYTEQRQISENLQHEVQRLQTAAIPEDDAELFSTVATGRTWHRLARCHHLRGVRTRAMRPCTDCSRNG